MKIDRSLSIIDEDESKYNYNPSDDETNYTIISPMALSSITMILSIVYESYHKMLNCLKWGDDDIDKTI
jgi:hypothetical protein